MKKILFICCIAITILLCSCSSKESKLFDKWEPWVVSQTVNNKNELYNNFQNHYCNNEQNNLISNLSAQDENEEAELKDKQKMIEKIYKDISNSFCEGYFKLLSEFEYKENLEIFKDVFFEWEESHTWTDKKGVSYWKNNTSKYSYTSYNIDWFYADSCNAVSFLNDIVGRCGKFSDFREFVCNSTSVYSSKITEKEKQHKVYEVIYRIQFGDVDKYVLCTILLQNDGSSEIEIVNDSDSLLDLI